MNIYSYKDLALAKTFQDAIYMGAAPRDLILLFPLSFPGEVKLALSKASRVHKDLMPERVLIPSKRITSLSKLLATKAILPSVSNFAKFSFSKIKELDPLSSESLAPPFLETLKEWNAISEKPDLSFQDAFVVFRSVANASQYALSQPVFVKCKGCKFSMLSSKNYVVRRSEICPYCGRKEGF